MDTLPAAYIDSHGHLMSEAPDDWVARMIEAMARQGIAAASLSGIAMRSSHEDDDVRAAHQRHPDRFFPFLCNFDPNDASSVDYVRRNLRDYPWAGIGELYLDTGGSRRMKLRLKDGTLFEHPYAVADDGAESPVLNSICELAAEHSVVVFLHCEDPEALSLLASQHPDTRFLAAHLDYRWAPEEASELLSRHPNVWADIGPVLKHGYRDDAVTPWAVPLITGWRGIMQAFPTRVCLGTDFFSWRDLQAPDHNRYYQAFEALLSELDATTRSKVRGGNFVELIRRDRPL